MSRESGCRADRPACVPWEEWPFHPANPHRLPAAAHRLYRLVTALARRFGWAFASAEYLAQRLGNESKRTWKSRTDYHAAYVRKLLRQLVACGLLERAPGGGGGRYRPGPPPPESPPEKGGAPQTAPVSGSRRTGERHRVGTVARSSASGPPRVSADELPPDLQTVYHRAQALAAELGRRWSLSAAVSDAAVDDRLGDALWAALERLETWLTERLGRPTGDPLGVIVTASCSGVHPSGGG